MSGETTPKHTPALLAGRWQIPLGLIAAVVASVTLFRLIPSPPPPEFDALVADVTVLEQAGDTVAAADAVANLLELDPPLPPAHQAVLHERMADLVFRAERVEPVHNTDNAKKVLEHSQAARELGHPASAGATLRDAFARRWLGEDDAALSGFRSALDQGLRGDDRRTALQALVQLLERRPEAKLERRQLLEHLLTEESVSAAYLWWGLHRAVQDALDDNDTPRAWELLNRYGGGLKNSNFRGYLDYLQASIMLHEGRPEEAAPLARWIHAWLGEATHSTAELDDFGHLASLNRCLMGKIHLLEDRPQDALADFDAALEYQPGPDLRVAASAGRGVALAALDRHAAALNVFRSALDEDSLSPDRRRRATTEFQQALLDLFEQQRARGDVANALAYLALAAGLVPDDDPDRQRELYEQLAHAYQAAARDATDTEQRRRYHEQAARSLEQAASRVTFDEPRLAELLWSAADQYDQAGRIGDVRRLLQEFVQGRSEHPGMPQALLQLGRAYEAYGQLEEALAWYTRVIAEYPRLEEAARAKVLSAGVQVSLGPERYADAEQMLTGLLTSDTVAPSAAVYRDALLALCELLYHQGRYAEEISRLQDLLTLYPEDVEHFRARFMLADAYRRSAYTLRNDPPAGVAAATAVTKSRERFRLAAERFDELLNALETVAQPDAALEVYARLALFYRGDCRFELNEPETLRAALATYRNAVTRYDAQPAALVAQVQIANVLLRLGEVTEAARAVERARWLLRGIPAETYSRCSGSNRADWERFLSVVSSSDLFQNVFAGTPQRQRTSEEER